MATSDLAYLAIICIALLLDHFALWPSFLRRAEVDAGSARVWIWSGWMSMLWVLVGAGVFLWFLDERDWGGLRLTVPHGWRLLGAAGLLLVLAFTYGRTAIRLARSPLSRRMKLRERYGSVAVVLPHTSSELGWFVALSLSAGFCEEFIFRGYLIWAFGSVLGLWGAAALSVVIFAAAHAYQGFRGALSSGVAGALLTLIMLGFGSLIPAVAVHALVDVGQGVVAWIVLNDAPAGDEGMSGPDESTQPNREGGSVENSGQGISEVEA